MEHGVLINWKAALYGRVSTEHEEQQESIRVQKEFLLKYAEENGYEVVSKYFDEGYSGTNFERPGIQFLRRDIEQGRINIILVKDLSRVGRSNPLTLLFLDYLSENNVRLVAVNDNYDTLKDEDDLIGIKTWFNELYSRELSKKIKFALKHKKKMGEYLTPYAPYGYKKSGTQRNKLERDYYAAKVVNDIFNMYIKGYGFQKIALSLQGGGIPNPSSYGHYSRKSDTWDWTMVRKIISNPVYTGCSVQQRYCKRSFKSRSISRAPESEWIKVDNTHEPIVDIKIFELAQDILRKRRSEVKYRCGKSDPHLFTSFLFCHECGSPLYYKGGVYRCGKYVRYGKTGCTSHQIEENELKEIVQRELVNDVKDLVNTGEVINDILNKLEKDDAVEEQIRLIRKHIEKTNRSWEILYKDKLNGVIGEDKYYKYAREINLVQSDLEIQKNRLIQEKGSPDKNELVMRVEEYLLFKDGVDRELLEFFIKTIEVCENGDILLYYNFTI